MVDAFKYRAFLSYSHVDTAMAKRVHGRLEGFHIDKELVGRATPTGPIPETLRPIFRDRYEFDAGGSLSELTVAALDGSAALIVLASPHAAHSKFVNEELRQFKSRHPDRPLIPLIVEGEPGDPEDECFPPALRFALAEDGVITNTPVDLLAADLREQGDGIELALAKVVARLIGLHPDDVYRRAERERRRQNRRRAAVASGFVAVVIAGLVAWWNEDWLKERVYAAAYAHPLSTVQEHTLKPGNPSFKECTDCPEMVIVPAGSFKMGSLPTDKYANTNEFPQHNVIIAKPFAVAKYELTFAEWDVCVAYGDCLPHVSDEGWGRGRQPVINVNWDDAQQYVAWLVRITGGKYRLLSEAEYEYAARSESCAGKAYDRICIIREQRSEPGVMVRLGD